MSLLNEFFEVIKDAKDEIFSKIVEKGSAKEPVLVCFLNEETQEWYSLSKVEIMGEPGSGCPKGLIIYLKNKEEDK